MFNGIKLHLDYFIGQRKNSATFSQNFSSEDFTACVEMKTDEKLSNLKVSIVPKSSMEIDKLYIESDFSFHSKQKVFVNGYQSWTDSREFFIDESLKSYSKMVTPLNKRFQFDKYGDYTFKKYSGKPGEFHGYTYAYIREDDNINFIGSLSERSGYTMIEAFVKKNKIVINKDCKGLYINERYIAFDIVWLEGEENEVFDRYFELMNIRRSSVKPMSGWTSWYNYYQNINEAIILENLENFKKYNKEIDIFQIDDGYQRAVGDWLLIDDKKFPQGMKYMADSIKSQGYKAGIWLAPFVCEKNSMIFKEKKYWILKDGSGQLVPAGGNWSGFYALDIYNEEVRQYLRDVFSVVIDQWGYDLVKLDFLYAVCLLPRKDKTRGQIMTEAMEFLRECVGDKLILGCGVPLGPSFGLVDYCRIGCDVSLSWDDKFYMKLFVRERLSTKNSISNAIGRRHLNGRAFLNDPDVFLLRDDNIRMSDTEKYTLYIANRIFGSLLFSSDNIKSYNPRKQKMFDQIITHKDINITQVKHQRNGLVEVFFTEDKEKYIALLNLGDSSTAYESKFSVVKEILYEDGKAEAFSNDISLEAHGARVFQIN